MSSLNDGGLSLTEPGILFNITEGVAELEVVTNIAM